MKTWKKNYFATLSTGSSNGRFIKHALIACGQVYNASATRHLKVRGKIKLIFQALELG